jgi:hypothetical protein
VTRVARREWLKRPRGGCVHGQRFVHLPTILALPRPP